MKIAIVTDSNSGITQEEAKKIDNLRVIPMPFMIEEEEYFEDINLTQEGFYQKLVNENANISTSQPAIGMVTEVWDELLKEYDAIIHMPMSSALSMSCETAKNFAKDYDGRVQVVDNKRISVILKQAIEDTQKLIEQGKSAEEIKEILEEEALNTSCYIMVSTLKYLKKGGRVTPAAALIGTLLKIKPVLQIQGGKLDAFAKVMNEKVAKQKMIQAVKKDLETRFAEYYERGEMVVALAHTNCPEKIKVFEQEVREALPNVEIKYVDPLSLSVSCHIGPGSLALVTMRRL